MPLMANFLANGRRSRAWTDTHLSLLRAALSSRRSVFPSSCIPALLIAARTLRQSQDDPILPVSSQTDSPYSSAQLVTARVSMHILSATVFIPQGSRPAAGLILRGRYSAAAAAAAAHVFNLRRLTSRTCVQPLSLTSSTCFQHSKPYVLQLCSTFGASCPSPVLNFQGVTSVTYVQSSKPQSRSCIQRSRPTSCCNSSEQLVG